MRKLFVSFDLTTQDVAPSRELIHPSTTTKCERALDVSGRPLLPGEVSSFADVSLKVALAVLDSLEASGSVRRLSDDELDNEDLLHGRVRYTRTR